MGNCQFQRKVYSLIGHNMSKWCKYGNFKQMYDLMYEATHVTCVTEKLSEPEQQNEAGKQGRCDNDEPVICGIIFVTDALSVEDRLGINIFAKYKDDIFCNKNYGPRKFFPGGLK